MWWVKLLVFILLAGAVFALFRALTSMMKDDSAGGRTVKALAWRVGLSVAVFLFLLLSMYMGWVQPHDVRPDHRHGVPIEQVGPVEGEGASGAR